MYSNSYHGYSFHTFLAIPSPKSFSNAHYLSKSEGEGRGDRSWRCVYNADVWSSDGQERYIRSSRVSRLTNNCSRFSLHFFLVLYILFETFCLTYYFFIYKITHKIEDFFVSN